MRLKVSPAGGVITVCVQQNDSHITVRVVDQGPGIPEEELEQIFDKFVQSSRTATGAGGTGLGLAICREIISQHDGQIWAENSSAKGACVCFELPRSVDIEITSYSPENGEPPLLDTELVTSENSSFAALSIESKEAPCLLKTAS